MVPDASYYGAVPSVQPTGSSAAQPNPEGTAPMRTTQHPARMGLFSQTSFWIVAIIAAAVLLIRAHWRWAP